MAMLYGVNANLLRKWIDGAARQDSLVGPLGLPRPNASESLTPAFVQLQVAKQKMLPEMSLGPLRLQARLPNGVGLEFDEATPGALSAILLMLSTLPCSS
jgi:transposase-like protein